jgi:putative peptide zinc metalloprotease protein
LTATVERAAEPASGPPPLERAPDVELIGEVRGSGYRTGTALVRRTDGRMVQLGPLLYALLELTDGQRSDEALAEELGRRIGKRVSPAQIRQLGEKLAAQGLLAGTEHVAPPAPNPLMSLRWKVLITSERWSQRLTRPFMVLFRPWLMFPTLAAFAVVVAYVLFSKGLASATADAFNTPGWLLVVFVLAVASAGIHEMGHAAACSYGGARPRGMGAGLYLVWPCFYTDVTDAYRLDRRGRLRVDLGGLYFNAVIAVLTAAVWLVVRRDALLLLIALQLLQMVRQLSPVVRADGYHILTDLTGVPDLFSHMGPTMRRLLPSHRRTAGPSPLRRRARWLVTVWVLLMVPILASLTIGAVLVLPRLMTSGWDSGRRLVMQLPHQGPLGAVASVLELLALLLPAVGTLLMTHRMVRGYGRKAWVWSRGRPLRRAGVGLLTAGIVAALAFAWWPTGQYQPVRSSERGTLGSLVDLLGSPRQAPVAARATSGERMLALVMVPHGGVSASHPALLVLPASSGHRPVVVLATGGTGTKATGISFPFKLPSAPTKPGDSQALAVNTTDGGVVYDISYALVQVSDGAPVTQQNSAYAIASCHACTTVAVSFQVVLVVGQSSTIAPVNASGALNYNCPECVTSALADQLVVTLSAQPSEKLKKELAAALKKLNAIAKLGPKVSPAQVIAQVAAVQQEIEQDLRDSGLLTQPLPTASASATSAAVPTDSASPSATTSTDGSSTPTSDTSSASPSATSSSDAPTASPSPSASATSP